ncbi:MAG: virulence factor [Acidimicrobiales bacterium]
MPRRRTGPELVIIYWRDIPTHVNGVDGRTKHQFPLKPRFEQAVDRAAMREGLSEASAYIGEVRRESRPAGEDPRAEAEALAAALDAKFTLETLNIYVANGGFAPEGVPQ